LLWKESLKQWWSTIPPISTKRSITCRWNHWTQKRWYRFPLISFILKTIKAR
jgi:hypothetical protein